MRRRDFTLLFGCLIVWPLRAAEKTARIAFLGNSTAALEANLVRAFREGLRDLGYVEGDTILIEYRWAEGDYSRFPALIAELVDGIQRLVPAYDGGDDLVGV